MEFVHDRADAALLALPEKMARERCAELRAKFEALAQKIEDYGAEEGDIERRTQLDREWNDAEMRLESMVVEPGGPGLLVATTVAPGGEEVQTTCPAHAPRVTYGPASDAPPSWWPRP